MHLTGVRSSSDTYEQAMRHANRVTVTSHADTSDDDTVRKQTVPLRFDNSESDHGGGKY